MTRQDLQQSLQAEATALAGTLSSLQRRLSPARALEPLRAQIAAGTRAIRAHPFAISAIAAGVCWLAFGKKPRQQAPVEETAQEKDGGSATPITAPTPNVADFDLGPALGAFALGIAAAALLPRSATEERILAASGTALRKQAQAMGNLAISSSAATVRDTGTQAITDLERMAAELIDGFARLTDDLAAHLTEGLGQTPPKP